MRTIILLGRLKVAYTCSYIYRRVTFIGARFSLRTATCEYAAISALERQCAHLQFQEPRTKLWLFDTLVIPTLRYGVEMWALNLNNENNLKDLERFFVSMIAHMIRRKALGSHDIMYAEM